MLHSWQPVKSFVKHMAQWGGTWAAVALAAYAAGCSAGQDQLTASDPDHESSGVSTSASTSTGSEAPSRYNRDAARHASDGDPSDGDTSDDASDEGASEETTSGDERSSSDSANAELPPVNFADGPVAGNPEGDCAVPLEARPVDTSSADNVVGNGTAASCTGDAFIEAVDRGGLIRFDCGPEPITITLDRPAKVRNDASDDVVIDGQGKVTLSGGGSTRILYMNTCDPDRVWTTAHCDNQETPRLTVQNLTFVDANSEAESEYDGGGAIWVRGGRFKVINSRFFNNRCADTGPDVGGGGLRVFSQYNHEPVYVVQSTFGGAEGLGNVCSNGGGLSSIDVSWNIINSVFSHNRALGNGGNPAESGTPGGGSGGAIYNDGNTMTLSVCGTHIEENQVNAYGSAIFFVSNSHTGSLRIEDSVIRNNAGGGWNVLPGISMHEDTDQLTLDSIIE
jgi:hypothetical protein